MRTHTGTVGVLIYIIKWDMMVFYYMMVISEPIISDMGSHTHHMSFALCCCVCRGCVDIMMSCCVSMMMWIGFYAIMMVFFLYIASVHMMLHVACCMMWWLVHKLTLLPNGIRVYGIYDLCYGMYKLFRRYLQSMYDTTYDIITSSLSFQLLGDSLIIIIDSLLYHIWYT